jgi:hypothetical protein
MLHVVWDNYTSWVLASQGGFFPNGLRPVGYPVNNGVADSIQSFIYSEKHNIQGSTEK